MILRREELHHMCISVKGALLHNKPRKMAGWMDHEDGTPMTGKEVYAQFKKAEFEGKRVLPMGDCDNFDYQTGCRGHGVTLLLHDWEWENGNG